MSTKALISEKNPGDATPAENGIQNVNGEKAILTNGRISEFDGLEVAASNVDETQWPAKKRRPLRLVLPLLALLALLSVAAYFALRPGKPVASATVRRGTIISSVETTGKIEAEKSAKLSFRASGRVEKIMVRQGAAIEPGAVLAELDTEALRLQVSEAETQLEISKLKLRQAGEGANEADVRSATAALNGALAGLDQVKAGARPEEITAAQSKLNEAQAVLDAVKRGPGKGDIAAAQARLDGAKASRDLIATTAANDTEQARILYVLASSATQNFLDPTGKVEQARLNYEAARSTEKLQVEAAGSKVTEAQLALDKLKAGPTREELKQAEEAVAQAKAGLDQVKRDPTPQEIAQAQSRVDIAQAALDKVKAGPGGTDLAILEQGVKLSKLSVDNANAQLAEAQLISPIGGTVLSIDLEVGELVGGMQPVAEVADIRSLRIKADVDEIDIGRVRPGQVVTVTLDAYPGVKLPGKIEALAPGATQKQGSSVYQATISFTTTGGVVPREGMAANVDITAQRKDAALLVPNRAIEAVGSKEFVTLMESGGNRKVEVETGLSNAADTEVISGLQEGQIVLLK